MGDEHIGRFKPWHHIVVVAILVVFLTILTAFLMHYKTECIDGARLSEAWGGWVCTYDVDQRSNSGSQPVLK